MAGAAAVETATGTWYDQRRRLFHGIPCRISARGLTDAGAERCWRMWTDAGAVFNRYADSELRRLDDAPDGTRLSPTLAWGLRAALRAWSLSRRACDPTAGALVDLWRAAVAAQRWPTDEEVARARATLAADGVAIDGDDRLSRARPCRFDLGGIIKGALVDLVDDALRRAGARDALVQIGGETSCRGGSPRGAPWRIGVQHPLHADGTWTVISAPAGGLSCSTSADYRRDAAIGGRPVAHLIDPRSGLPADADLLSASVVIPAAGRVADAEALTKAAVFLEPTAAADAADAVGGALLVLRARDDGIEELATAAWPRMAAP